MKMKRMNAKNWTLSIVRVLFVLMLATVAAGCSCNGKKKRIDVSSIEFVYEGATVTECELPLFATGVAFELKVNGKSASEFKNTDLSIEWGFVGESYEAKIDADGFSTVVNDLGYVLGEMCLYAKVESRNTMEVQLPIQITAEEGFAFDSISAIGVASESNTYIEGQLFDANSITVWGHYGEYNPVRLLEYTCPQYLLTPDMLEVEIAYEDKRFEYPIYVKTKSLQSLTILSGPSQTEYLAGQHFDITGLTVQANYEYLSEIVEDYKVNLTAVLLEDMDSVQISYTYKDVTKTAELPITVLPRKLLAIAVDHMNVQKEYTAGDSFDRAGLIVKAEFENFGWIEVDDYVYTARPLRLDDEAVEIAYTSGEVSFSEQVAVSVKRPYEHIAQLRILTPEDIQISWAYQYWRENGEYRLDNTAYAENNLVYDKINGEYEIPVGAEVTAYVRNPAVITLAIDGEEQKIDLVEKSFSWKLRSSQTLSMNSIEMQANHAVVRFLGDEKEQSFLYEGYWNGIIAKEDVERLSAVFADTELYYYTYLVDGKSWIIADLQNAVFVKNSIITVAKNMRGENAKNVVLHVGEDVRYTIRIANDEAEKWSVPAFKNAGYYYDGWATSDGGAKLTDAQLTELISSDAEQIDLYIRWIEETVDYSNFYLRETDGERVIVEVDGTPLDKDVRLTGEWKATLTSEQDSIQCTVQFKADGTFVYSVVYNGEVNCSYQGKYRLAGNSIVVITSQPTLESPYLNGVDFAFGIGKTLQANGIVVMGQEILLLACEFEKVGQ